MQSKIIGELVIIDDHWQWFIFLSSIGFKGLDYNLKVSNFQWLPASHLKRHFRVILKSHLDI